MDTTVQWKPICPYTPDLTYVPPRWPEMPLAVLEGLAYGDGIHEDLRAYTKEFLDRSPKVLEKEQ